jgi:hypothetical protein
MGVAANQNIKYGINTLGYLTRIELGHSGILLINSIEINDAKFTDKREVKK